MNTPLEWRRAEPGDADAVRQLTRDAYAKWVPLIGREPKPMSVDYEAAVLRNRFDLLCADGILVGLIETVDEGDGILVENVAVAPAFQGQGLGSKLMARAEATALSLGYKRIRLFTNKRFAENIELYRRLGFAVDGEADLGEGTIRVDMSKTL